MKKIYLLALAALALTACKDANSFDATGTFEATELTISAEANGRILCFNAEEGTLVSEGAALGVIDTTQLSLQLEMLRKQQSAILAGKPDVQKQVESIRRQITKQETELLRVQNLLKGHAATQKQVDDVEAQLSVLRSQLDATLQQLNASVASVDNNAAALEVQMRLMENSLAKCRIVAPADGTVLVKYAEAGEMAVAGKPLLKLADLQNMYLRAYFTSDQLADIRLGQDVKVIADFGGDRQIEYPGRISWIAAESEFTPKGIQTRNSRANLVYAVKIAVQNDGYLKIGMYGEVIL